MNITVTQLPETKVVVDRFKKYIFTYPEGYPITVRVITHCENCNVEIGGYFGNGVYRYQMTNLCKECGEADDPMVKMCLEQTGMTPDNYQTVFGRAWNE